MNKKALSNNDYVVFMPKRISVRTVYLKFQNIYIQFSSNEISYIQRVYDQNLITEQLKCDKSKIIASVLMIIDNNMFPKRFEFEEYDDSVFTKKDHPMYLNGVSNEVIESEGAKVYKYHYPNESVHIFNKSDNSFVSIVSNEKDAIKYSKFAIKQTLSDYLIRKNIFSIHAAAVSIEGKGYLFVSGGHTGKTTLYMNLISNGYDPVNDDIVFWKSEGEKIFLIPCPILPQIRRNKREDIIMSEKFLNAQQGLEKHKEWKWPVLETVFFPSLGNTKTSIERLPANTDIRKYLRACSIHHPIETSETFLESLKSLVGIPAFNLRLSTDYNDICEKINKFISKGGNGCEY